MIHTNGPHPDARPPLCRARRRDPARHRRAPARRGRQDRRRDRQAVPPLDARDPAAPAGAGDRGPDGETRRAPVPCRARTARGAASPRLLVRAPAAPLVRCLRPARSRHRRRNPEEEEVMSTATKEKITLRMERIIAATPATLFALWTEPEKLVKWGGPEGYTTPTHAMDVRAGGRWRTTMRNPDGKDHIVSGIYRAIEPPMRLVFTWGWDDDAGLRGHEPEVTVTCEPVTGGTRMVLTQQGFADADSRGRHEHGSGSRFLWLARGGE